MRGMKLAVLREKIEWKGSVLEPCSQSYGGCGIANSSVFKCSGGCTAIMAPLPGQFLQ
jgi:acetone carboxylase gamma subunit